MERHFGTGEASLRRSRLATVSDKAKLVGLLIALAVVNLEVEHFRGYGLSGMEMLIGACAIMAAIMAYGCVRVYWEARECRKFMEVREDRQDQSLVDSASSKVKSPPQAY